MSGTTFKSRATNPRGTTPAGEGTLWVNGGDDLVYSNASNDRIITTATAVINVAVLDFLGVSGDTTHIIGTAPGPYTFSPPVGVTEATFEIIGGGGGGSGGKVLGAGGGGGSSSQYNTVTIKLVGGTDSFICTIGSGGKGAFGLINAKKGIDSSIILGFNTFIAISKGGLPGIDLGSLIGGTGGGYSIITESNKPFYGGGGGGSGGSLPGNGGNGLMENGSIGSSSSGGIGGNGGGGGGAGGSSTGLGGSSGGGGGGPGGGTGGSGSNIFAGGDGADSILPGSGGGGGGSGVGTGGNGGNGGNGQITIIYKL